MTLNSRPRKAERRQQKTLPKPLPKPLNEQRLKDLALHYLGRFASTRARLVQYLNRKIRERGWEGADPPDCAALADRCAELGYVDDAVFASMKGGALLRRGFGARRVEQALAASGVQEADRADMRMAGKDQAATTALAFARRKRIGPFADQPADADKRRKQLQAFIRAGHDFALARKLVFADSMDELAGLEEEYGRE